MGFLNQIMLWGLAGVSVPIIIHLLNRFRHRQVHWGAMELLRRAMVMRSRRVQIEDLILLILRCLAVGLLAMSMARPTVRARGARFFGGESRVAAVIALDASYSMEHKPGMYSRFDAAKQKAREVLRSLEPGDQVSLVLLGQRPRILLRNVTFDPSLLEREIEKASVLPERLNLDLCLRQLAALAGEARAPVRECYVISDSQRVSWERLSDDARQSIQQIDRAGKLYYLSVASGMGENLAITDFRLVSGALRRGSTVQYLAEVVNLGRAERRGVRVALDLDGKRITSRVIPLVPPARPMPVALYATFRRSGNVRAVARLDQVPDAVGTDNVRFAVARVHDRVRVLLVDGDPAVGVGVAAGAEDFRSETHYVATALVPNPEKPEQATIAVTRTPYQELPTRNLADHDIVMLANVPDVHTTQARALFSFVERGGGLLVFLGDKVNPRLMNEKLRLGQRSLLGMEVKAAVKAHAETGWPVEVTEAGHPIARALSQLPSRLLDEVRVHEVNEVSPGEDARVILRAAGSELPLLVERRLGRGNVLVFTSSADRGWNNLPMNPAYLMLLQEAVGHLTRRSHERQFTVGEALAIAVPQAGESQQAVLADPAGQTVPIQVTETDGARTAECGPAEMTGFYELTQGERAEPLAVAVNVDAFESDVRSLAPEQLRSALAQTPARLPAPGADLATVIKEGRRGFELWRILMIAGLVILAVESFLAWHFGRRMVVSAVDLSRPARAELLERPTPKEAA
jgi:hypothetical protein